MKNWIITFTLLLSCKFLAAQTVLVPYNGTLYWVGRASSGTTVQVGGTNYTVSSNSWYHPANWSTFSGGSSSADLYPGSNTDVIFDENSVNDYCQVQASSSSIGMPYVKSLTLETNYSGSISSNTTYRYRIGSKLEVKGGTFNAPFNVNTSSAGITLDNGADFILSGGIFNMPAVFQMGGINGSNRSEFIIQGGTFNNAVVAFNAASGDVNLNSSQSTLFTTSGSSITISSGYSLYNLVLSSPTIINSNIVVKNRLGVRSGGGVTTPHDFNNYTITVGESVADNANSLTFGSITNPAHLAEPSTADAGYWRFSNGTIKVVKGNIYLNNGAGASINQAASTGILEIAGIQDQYLISVTAISGTIALGYLPNLVVNKPNGTLFLQGVFSARGNWTLQQGNVDPLISTVQWRIPVNESRSIYHLGDRDAMPFYNLSVYQGELIFPESMKINGSLSIYKNSKLTCSLAEDPLYLYGNLYVDNTSITTPSVQAGGVFNSPSLDYLMMEGNNQTITFTNGQGIGSIPMLSIKNNVQLNSDLEISSSLQILNTGLLDLSSRSLVVKGIILNNGVINSSSATIQFTGTDLQQWTNSNGTEQTIGNVIMNNANGLQLNSPIRINANLNLQNGKIFTSSANLLTLNDNATITGFSNSSYVVGPLKKVGDDFVSTFTFPVGSAVRYKPVTLSDAINNTISDEFTVTYFQATPPSSTNLDTDEINGINNQEYWDIHRSVGATTALKIQLPWSAVEGTSWASNAITIVHFNGTEWEQPSTTSVNGISGSGTVTTNNRVGSFSEWSTGEDIIIMPVSFIDFDGNVSVVNQYDLSWSTATELNNGKFILEKSSDGQHYEKIAEVLGSGNSRSRNDYHFTYSSEKYYSNLYFRLLQQDYDGKQEFLKLIQVHNLNEKQLVYPNLLQANTPTKLNFTLNENQESFSEIVFAIYDISGKVISRDVLGASKAIDVCLTSGTYVLKISTKAGLITSKLFVH